MIFYQHLNPCSGILSENAKNVDSKDRHIRDWSDTEVPLPPPIDDSVIFFQFYTVMTKFVTTLPCWANPSRYLTNWLKY